MVPRVSKRAVLVEPHRPVEVWERPMVSPKSGEVVLSVHMGGVCGTDVHFMRGEVELPGPMVLGHEGIGSIEELGQGVSTDYAGTPVQRGDRVYWVPLHPCHRCYYCTVVNDVSLCANLLAGLFRDANEPSSASYAEHAWLPDGMPFFRIPDDTPSEPVIAFGCAMPTMIQGLERLGGIDVNQTVVVQGSGPVGLAATLLANIAGARQIIVIGAPERRLEMARRLGATATINIETIPQEETRIQSVMELTDGRGAEVVIEAAGAVPAFAEGLNLVAKGGRYLIVGLWSEPGTVAIEPRFVNNTNIRIIGTALFQPRHFHQAILVAQAHHQEYPMADAVTHRFPLEEAQDALDTVARLESIKAVIVPQ